LFNLWLGPGNFVGYRILAVFLIYETFEAHSYIISTSSRATNDEAFGISSLIAGLLKILLATLFIRTSGLFGIALATMLALLLTNHWYMVFRGLKRLQLPFSAYAKEVLVPAFDGGKSGLRRAGWRVITAGRKARESATESRPPRGGNTSR